MTDYETELRACLQAWRAPGIGGASIQRLLSHFGSVSIALDSSDQELTKAGLKPAKIALLRATKPDDVNIDIEWLQSGTQRHILLPSDPDYPAALKNTQSPPPLLFAVGNTSLLNDPQIAMVGSRSPTTGGKDNARAFASHLAQNGLCITSGLALGIDAISHTGALDSDGSTIAVVATGMDIIYPSRNRKLAERIAEQGLIVSEFPVGVRPQAQNFPRRNRIISGMSVGTLVVESALRSGSLVTARHAMEQGREVFAIPGSIHNPMARGCHQLIRQGAKLVETATDILEEISAQLHIFIDPRHSDNPQSKIAGKSPQSFASSKIPAASSPITPDEYSPDSDECLILDVLGHDPVPVDQIVLKTGLTTEEVSSMLLMMELQGYIAACGGGHYMRLTSRE
ncbi:MAG: Rossmann fold nucleotide-binding protein Smf possibly involved in DNA uptake [uncultured Thiotrichaceae bacterium]|uniref:Rossmann fold nucleotide-binding protein Smf possibly involved in DNA uptake n=1 Tax=uncultured Thiotrichaceae bacterium TaxID=298394 RepID=A0A6S6TQ43_9GAMM|nr:MAG: Rossmann fold nucleotide-binding protein Smf possibly involved in DNA uptake [uncultured Thiotrichaceae bacterium]